MTRLVSDCVRWVALACMFALGLTSLPGCATPQAPSGDSPGPLPPPKPRPRETAEGSSEQVRAGQHALTVAEAVSPSVGKQKVGLVPFHASAFPYRGNLPDHGGPFLDVTDGVRKGHTSARGGVYWEDTTYADRRVLLAIPEGFDPRRPALLVVYFHGNLGRIDRDVVDRQQVVRQVTESGLNAVLVAPQLAVDALDSSAGHFWEAGHFNRFLHEAGTRIAELYGDRKTWQQRFDAMPVLIVAYSGGYLPAIYSLSAGSASARIHGVVLLDALYGEEDKTMSWILRHGGGAFFVSAYGPSTREQNQSLQGLLAAKRVTFATSLPDRLDPGKVVFVDVGDDAAHGDFVTHAWDTDPLRHVLSLVRGFARPSK